MIFINIVKEANLPFIKQIYDQIRKKILSGELQADEKLPSTRELANYLKLSRNTVMTAYEMLTAEGLTISKPGSGIYVNHNAVYRREPLEFQDYNISAFTITPIAENCINFQSGTPDLNLFPRIKWEKSICKAILDAPISAFGYDYPNGRPEFRHTLSDYLKKMRGIDCHPDQIIVTTGAKQGLSIVAKCLLNQETEVWLEDPTNPNIIKIFSYHTNRLVHIPVDENGILTNQFPKEKKPSLIFVTPSHQFPMGGILPIQRRLELIRFAQENGSYILEDDYDSEFRYEGYPIHSLRELDKDRVIYVGTFSKTLFPSIRLGYLVLPEPLIAQCIEIKRLFDHHSNSLNQLAAMRFIDSGDLEKHIIRMNRVYKRRRNRMITKLKEKFNGEINIIGEASGLHFVAEFINITFTPSLIRQIEQLGLSICTVEEHASIKGNHEQQVIIGFSHLTDEEMDQGIDKLYLAIKKTGCGV